MFVLQCDCDTGPEEWWDLHPLPLNLLRTSQLPCPTENSVSDVCYCRETPRISALFFLDILSWDRAIILWGSWAATWGQHLQVSQPKAPGATMTASQHQLSDMWVGKPADDSCPQATNPLQHEASSRWYHTEYRHAVPIESFPSYRFMSKINYHWCFELLVWGALLHSSRRMTYLASLNFRIILLI